MLPGNSPHGYYPPLSTYTENTSFVLQHALARSMTLYGAQDALRRNAFPPPKSTCDSVTAILVARPHMAVAGASIPADYRRGQTYIYANRR